MLCFSMDWNSPLHSSIIQNLYIWGGTFRKTEHRRRTKLVRQSQIVQSVMQDYQYDLSHLLSVCNLLVQGPKITYTYCLSRRSGLLWCFTLHFVHLNSLIRWTSKRDNLSFSMPTFVIWYFCFPRKVCNMIPVFSQKYTKEDMLAFSLLEKNEIMLLTSERKGRTMILFHSRVKFSYHW